MIPIYQISMTSLAPSLHWEFSTWVLVQCIFNLNVMMAPEMASIFGLWGLLFHPHQYYTFSNNFLHYYKSQLFFNITVWLIRFYGAGKEMNFIFPWMKYFNLTDLCFWIQLNSVFCLNLYDNERVTNNRFVTSVKCWTQMTGIVTHRMLVWFRFLQK